MIDKHGFCGGICGAVFLPLTLPFMERWATAAPKEAPMKSPTLFSNNFRFSVLLTRVVSTLNLNSH